MKNIKLLSKHSHVSRLASHTSQGFTLMELLVVIAILGILIGVGLTNFLSTQKKSRDNRRKTDLKNISTALETYYNDKGLYPAGDVNGNIMGCGANATAVCSWGGEWSNTTNSTSYMITVPADPASNLHYFYRRPGLGKYQLYARLENTNDMDIPSDVSSFPNCATNVQCDYGVSSGNINP